MREILVKDLMVPLANYATVSQDEDIFAAMTALSKSWEGLERHAHRHRAVLVLDSQGQVVGKLNQFSLIRVLEPKYSEIGDMDRLSHWGLNLDFLRSIVEQQQMWTEPLEMLCARAAALKIKDVMSVPGEGDYITEDDSLAHACHLLVMGHKLSLLVTREGKVVGVLRLVDVFDKIRELIGACKI